MRGHADRHVRKLQRGLMQPRHQRRQCRHRAGYVRGLRRIRLLPSKRKVSLSSARPVCHRRQECLSQDLAARRARIPHRAHCSTPARERAHAVDPGGAPARYRVPLRRNSRVTTVRASSSSTCRVRTGTPCLAACEAGGGVCAADGIHAAGTGCAFISAVKIAALGFRISSNPVGATKGLTHSIGPPIPPQ
jgi:hypothetical protein